MKISDLLDFDPIQKMVDANYRSSGIPIGVIDVETGEVYAGAGWQRICLDYHRKDPVCVQRCIESDTAVKRNIEGRDYYGYKCANGLWDIGIPIYIAGEYSVTLFLGQFFYEGEVPEQEFFENQGKQRGFDVEDYIKALYEVPVFSREKVENILEYNKGFAKFIGDLATKNLLLQREVDARRKTEAELSKAGYYIQNVLDSMPSILVGVDGKGLITHWNRTAEKETGLLFSEAEGKPLEDVLPVMSGKTEKINESILKRESVHLSRLEKNAEGRGRSYMDITIYPLMTDGAEGAVVRIDDVTGKAKIDEILMQTEKIMSVAGLAAGMAHEINNPLAGIIQTTNVMADRLYLKKNLPANRKAAEDVGTSFDLISDYMQVRGIVRMVESLKEAGTRLSEIVGNMLSFSRKSESSFSTLDMCDLVDRTVELALTDFDLKKEWDFKKVKIIKDYQEGIPEVICERGQIQQVILNMLRNAAQAFQNAKTPDPMITINIIHSPDSGRLNVAFTDNGPGMTEEVRRRVFEPFYTTKPVGVGTGLGLSVSYFIITETHGGSLSVESAPGHGTSFLISLPLQSI